MLCRKQVLQYFCLVASCSSLLANAVSGWSATVQDVGVDEYLLTMQWTHDPNLVQPTQVSNPGNQDGSATNGKQGVCDPDSGARATDGLLYWVPRIFAMPVSAEITQKTGVQYASVDWQPCGHKDVVICHAESHYDFHLYYVPQSEVNSYNCEGPNPTCPDTDADSNQRFFKLLKGNLPSFSDKGGNTQTFNYCVDPTSALPKSGIHYGDKSETLNEWKNPVTIIGSYDCKLTFFEPMISWKWISNTVRGGANSWPKWESGRITYDSQTYKPLPREWSVEVGPDCATSGAVSCWIRIVVRGKRCDSGGCGALPQECSQQKSCITNQLTGRMPASTPILAPSSGIMPSSSSSNSGSSGTSAGSSSSGTSSGNSGSSFSTSSGNTATGPGTSGSSLSTGGSSTAAATTPPQPVLVDPIYGSQRLTVSGLNGATQVSGRFVLGLERGIAKFLGTSKSKISILQTRVVQRRKLESELAGDVSVDTALLKLESEKVLMGGRRDEGELAGGGRGEDAQSRTRSPTRDLSSAMASTVEVDYVVQYLRVDTEAGIADKARKLAQSGGLSSTEQAELKTAMDDEISVSTDYSMRVSQATPYSTPSNSESGSSGYAMGGLTSGAKAVRLPIATQIAALLLMASPSVYML
ncbi:unnamed protein product [Amoebophrya sp. A25]|nr:unnamed protein product [Amoebophrya sp. A25]|eukprot:GSA25T00000557001.1